MQRLADIDVAEPGNNALIHEERLEIGAAAMRALGQISRAEVLAERLHAETGEQRMRFQLRFRNEQHEAEPARIVVGDFSAARHAEEHVVMLGVATSDRRHSRRG